MNNTMLRCLVLLAVYAVGCSAVGSLSAQSPAASERIHIGAFGHYIGTTHTAGFRQIPGYPLPPETSAFADGDGSGSAAGLAVDIPFSAFLYSSGAVSRVRLGLHLGYLRYNGVLEAEEPALVLRNNGTTTPGSVTHTVTASMSSVFFEPTIGFVPLGGLQVYMGGQIAVPLSATFVQTQQVGRPLGAVFADPESRIPEQRGDIPGRTSPSFAASVGMSYAFPLDRRQRLLFVPELTFTIPLSDVADGLDWQVSSVRAGVALLYAPGSTEPPRRDTVFLRDTVMRVALVEQERVYIAEIGSAVRQGRRDAVDTLVISEYYVREVPRPSSPLRPSLAVGVRRDGLPTGDTVALEEHVVNTATPLLGYVFFDSASARLPERYVQITAQQAASFSAVALRPASAMEVYRHMLNILGERLQQSGRSVTLTGCNDGLGERGSGIARERAERVREYLVQVWNIAPERIRVQVRDLPASASNPATPEGAAENRRVELAVDDAVLARPLLTSDTTIQVRTQSVVLYPGLAEQGVSGRWSLTIGAENRVLFTADGALPLPDSLVWPPEARALLPFAGRELTAVLTVQRADNPQAYTAERRMPVHLTTAADKRRGDGDSETERYSLLLFDFDGARLSSEQQTMVRTLAARLQPGDRITVTGTTDAIGDEEYNRRLSLARARAVAKALNRADVEVIGAGEDSRSLPGDLPEGRFYSRAVTITVERTVRDR